LNRLLRGFYEVRLKLRIQMDGGNARTQLRVLFDEEEEGRSQHGDGRLASVGVGWEELEVAEVEKIYGDGALPS
jgi:hypothetical protein